jgi:hypothetical protein
LETKAKINPASASPAAGNFRKGYVQVGTKQGSYAKVTFNMFPRSKRASATTGLSGTVSSQPQRYTG